MLKPVIESTSKRFLVCVFCVVTMSALAAAAQTNDSRVDGLFAAFQGKSPGCAVGVVQDGKTVFAKAYGMADLEHEIPLSPDSPFYMASVSKQFTAMSVLLLAEDGKLQVSDSVRKTMPELPDYADKITLNHLLTHTSGVRDYLTLGNLAGLPPDFVHTDRSALRAVARQASLNFEPGSEFLYSNSGYVLLSLVVKRVADKSLNDFAQSRIFGPLDMKSTRFQHDHSALIPGRALGYERRQDRWHIANSMLDVVGDGGLYSSVQDMLRWAKNFDSPTVGAKALAIMQTPGRLKSGSEISYGMGLAPGEYKGLRIVEHSGGLAGYRTEFLRFPSQKFSVICLCNNATANPSSLARQVAQVYLDAKLTAAVPAVKTQTAPAVSLAAEDLRSMAGLYRSDEHGYMEISMRDGKLRVAGWPELIALDRRRFTAEGAPDGLEIEFDAGSSAAGVQLRLPGEAARRYVRVTPVTLSDTQRQAYTGDFESRELQVTYRISADASGLSVEIGDRPPASLTGSTGDFMRVTPLGLELSFTRDAAGRVTGFKLNAGRVRGIVFTRRGL